MLALYKTFKYDPNLKTEEHYKDLICIVEARNNWDNVPKPFLKQLEDGTLFHRWI